MSFFYGKSKDIQSLGNAMNASQTAYDLIKHFESLKLRPYKDENGKPTVGWGHTRNVKFGMSITEEEAERLFADDIANVERALASMLKVIVLQHEYDALASFVFNVGGWKAQTSTLIRKVNLKDPLAPVEFLRWNKITDHQTGRVRVSNGLTHRRQAEMRLFSDGVLLLV